MDSVVPTQRRSRLSRGRDLLTGTAVEVAWVGAHVATYPLGALTERTRPLPERTNLADLRPAQRGLLIGDIVAAGTPILLVHGLMDNRAIFTVLRRQLARRGFGRISTHNYSVFTSDVRAAAVALGAAIEKLCEETGYDRIHVVGHSLGGLIARYYIQRQGGDARVHTLVTLGTPHAGSVAARLLPTRVCRQLRPGSGLLTELAEPAPGVRTRFLAFWSDLDELVVPARNSRLEHPDLQARNVRVTNVGHMALPCSPTITREIALALAHLESDGHRVPEPAGAAAAR